MELHGNDRRPFSPPEATTETRIIRIIDGSYNLQFSIEDGDCISVDGKPYRLHYCDETHFKAENMGTGRSAGFFHICEFGQRVVDRGCVVAKMDK